MAMQRSGSDSIVSVSVSVSGLSESQLGSFTVVWV